MRIDILTVVPELLTSPLNESILHRAQEKGLVRIVVHNLHDYAHDRRKTTDDYPFGAIAVVRCNGLTLCNYGGKIELGAEAGDYGAEAIPREELPRYIRVTLPEEGEKHRASPLIFGEVSARHIDTRVRFDGVRFADAGKTWCDTDPETGRTVATERVIVDAQGSEFTVRSAATCAYAKEPLPSGTGSLYGIIDYFAGKYTLRVTNREVVF